MIQPGANGLDALDLPTRRQRRARNQDHPQAQGSCRRQLGDGTTSSGVFSDQEGDAVPAQQGCVFSLCEGAAGDDETMARQGGRTLRFIDDTQQIVVLRLRRESGQRLPTDRQHDPLRRTREGRHGCRDIRNLQPIISRLRFPGRPREGQKRDSGEGARGHRVTADLSRERVGRVYQMSDAIVPQIGRQPLDAAETADTARQRLTPRPRHAASVGQRGLQIARRQFPSQVAGFAGPAEYEQVGCHV